MKQDNKYILIIRWVARIWGSISLAFMLLFVGAHLIGSITGESDSSGGFNSVTEMIAFICFPVSTIIGLAVAWKWEGVGGFITIIGIIGFHIILPHPVFDLIIDGLAAPGLVFILYWFLSKRLNAENQKNEISKN